MENKDWPSIDQENRERAYETPELIRYGTVIELTLSGDASYLDATGFASEPF